MDGSTLNGKDISDLSDEELMGMSSPDSFTLTEEADNQPVTLEESLGSGENNDDPSLSTENETDTDEDAGEDRFEEAGEEVETASGDDGAAGEDETDPATEPSAAVDPEAPQTDQDVKTDPEKKEDATDYEHLYKQIMAPFQANGRQFALSSPEEAVQLMQMGANYTKKMQALAPKMKLIRMLEKNELLDEAKISFLIDLDKKNPDAVAKLVKDSNIDPMDIDTSEAQAYKPGNHRVSDDEMAFSDALSTVMSTEGGKETVRTINSSWDESSKQAVYKEPSLLTLIDTHRANGLYARISAEIDRQQILGRLTNIPFIEAYKQAGTELQQAGFLSPTPAPAQQDNGNVEPAKVTGRREANPGRTSSRVPNGEQARRVSPAPNAGKTVKKAIDPFDLTDEQIMAMKSLKV